jgi:DNA-directed RNA polymerase specialized sigma24 family protein
VDEKNDNLIRPIVPEQLGRVIDRHADALELYARQLCNCAEDVVQEAFIELACKQGMSDDNIAFWLYRVVRNKALSASRAARRKKRVNPKPQSNGCLGLIHPRAMPSTPLR